MKPDDPERYIRDLERGPGQTPGPMPEPPGSQSDAFTRIQRRFEALAQLSQTKPARTVMVAAFVLVVALGFFWVYNDGKTTVHGDLVMINSGATDSIDCNNGNVKLDGDNNIYTITGHCRRLDIFGSANHVTVDSADVIGVFGDDNAVAYHTGAPTINKTGNNNIVTQRLKAL